MDVIEGILGEAEMSMFDADDFGDFYVVLNNLTAWRIREYMQSPDANPSVVEHINKHIGEAVKSLTIAKVLQEEGVMEMLTNINPGTILVYARNNPDCYNKLKMLEDNYTSLRPNNNPPTSKDFQRFKSMLSRVLDRMKANGMTPTYPDIMRRVQENSFLFYSPHMAPRGNNVGMLLTRRNIWHMCFKGLDFDRYCVENGITNAQRRLF